MRLLLLIALLMPSVAAAVSPCDVVSLKTEDGLTLQADHCRGEGERPPVIVLMHMIPPHHDRTNYPPAFLARLQQAGFTVMNVDRRGAGTSEGEARDAYNGPKGPHDVEAARSWLKANDPTANLEVWACVGASNGTTTCLDHAIGATPAPKALVFLTGGSYTENQNKLVGSAAESLPILFTYNGKENAWSEAQQGHGAAWEFEKYSPGAHGTKAFGTNPEAMDDVVTFLKKTVK